MRLAVAAVAVSSLWSAGSVAANCPPTIPDCRPCRYPVCNIEGFWVCDPASMQGATCNVPICGNAGICNNGTCNPLPNSTFQITKIGEAGAIADPAGAVVTVSAFSSCQAGGGQVLAGVTSQALVVSPSTPYTISSTQPAGYEVSWAICNGSCSWTSGASVTLTAPLSGTTEIRFRYLAYTAKVTRYRARYYRGSGYTSWSFYSSCNGAGHVTDFNVKSLDFPSDPPFEQIGRFTQARVRNSPDGWGKCATNGGNGASYATPNWCTGAPPNEIGIDVLLHVLDDPSYSDPALLSSIGRYPYPDQCELLLGGAQVCHERPFPQNVTPTVSLPINVTPAIPSGVGICSPLFTQCLNQCGDLDVEQVIGDPFTAVWCANNCNPPGPVTEHWKHVAPVIYGDERLTTVSGLVGGGTWDDGACVNGLLCNPGATCRSPSIADGDFGPHHFDRDFNFSIVPITNGAIDGSALNSVDVDHLAAGGLPSVDVEIEYEYFYPRQGAPTYSGDFLLSTPHYSLDVKSQAAPGAAGVNGQPTQGPSFRSPVLSRTNDGWSADMPMVGDQIATRGVLIWDCGHLERDGTGSGFHTELHPAVATAWLHRPLPEESFPQSRYSTLFVKALSHAPYPSGTAQPFDGLSATFSMPDYDNTLPICISDPIVDHNAGMQSQSTFHQYDPPGWVWDATIHYPSQQVYGVMLGGPDLVVPGTTIPKYWNIAVTHLGSGRIGLALSGNFPGGSDYNIQDATILQNAPLMLGTHYRICQPKRDSSGNIINNCLGTCDVPSSDVCAPGTAKVGVYCVPVTAPATIRAKPQGNTNNLVDVTWSAVAGATSYRLYRGDGVFGDPLVPLPGTFTSTSTTDTDAWGGTYHYVVTSLKGAFESGRSNTAPVTLYPATPTGVTAVGGAGQVTVSWAAMNGATSYRIYSFDGATYVYAAYTTSTSQVFTGLASQTTYSYAVEAWNATGGSIRSPVVSATTLYTCNPTTCPTGCCSGNTCQPGNLPAYGCASGGSACKASCVGSNTFCSGGVCGCTPTTCSSLGWNCDPMYNGCSDVVSCGACSGYQTCGGGGTAHVCGCTPLACNGRCGNVSDGCGGTRTCAGCPGGQQCLPGNVCGCPSGTRYCRPGCYRICP